MSAFTGLLWKDFKTSILWFYSWIVIILLLFLIGVIIGHHSNELRMSQLFLIMIGVLHITCLPGMIGSMLRLEGKTQLWLHSPHNGFMLLLPKLIIAFIYSTLSLLMIDGLGVLMMVLYPADSLFSYWPIKEGILFNLGVTLVGLYFSGWVIFLWTFYHSLSKYPTLKNIRWLFIIGFIIIYQTVVAFFMSIQRVETFFLDTFTVEVSSGIFLSVGAHEADVGLSPVMIPLPVMPFLFEALIMVIILTISCRLLDRRVEV
ncbi:hypothetical protein [Bacillus sp. KH172YL63]|uniref:hypothetical protein n=1 Tax=Bacillus sp. KH172YL63 TaxID=2709784 RepID=UPI0013E4B3EB|nr:hypothetical protein [Bacillus sp. KH172YL63]BCB04944.1 hypothetical protein KH172YL63_30770 [Bacillus sp. KH172YL63]